MENKLLELTLRRRSIRKYNPTHIDDNIINEIMKVALTAPTSFGHQAIEFVVVRDKKIIYDLGACKSLGGSQINGSDTVIVTLIKTTDKRQSEFWIEDGSIASTYIILAAEQYNLGACWVHIRNRMGAKKTSDEEIRELLNIPNGYTVLNMIALGEKGEVKRAYVEDDLQLGNIHYDSF